ncbi:class I SAM-dependent methyltransferase [Sphingosinithalassobacter sp. CS137]|uniref:class I SAM-dependent methyltransferase n=1 Tax=Sphingosinithalassobacter sp. CS137 TaxID=2762748 RepID=UPI00165DBF14|nr:class I SAM-dependent methyltransferase [Sphingosinithalassobacter sp. CS137]
MSERAIVENDSEPKANMDAIYVQPDPRAYFRELAKVDYTIPDLAKPIFRRLVEALSERRAIPLQALDLGCSYGVNAALLKHDLSMEDLRQHWTRGALAHATAKEIVEADREFFGEDRADNDIAVIGLDQSEPAIAFAEEAGLLESGMAVDLENVPLPAIIAEKLAGTDLVLSTGAVGYITEQTFGKLLPAITRDSTPWIANFVLRMFPFDAIAETLAQWGYVTEKLEGRTFVQRSFVSDGEQARVIAALEKLGIDAAGLESEGQLHAEFFLSRPRDEAEALPLERLLAD